MRPTHPTRDPTPRRTPPPAPSRHLLVAVCPDTRLMSSQARRSPSCRLRIQSFAARQFTAQCCPTSSAVSFYWGTRWLSCPALHYGLWTMDFGIWTMAHASRHRDGRTALCVLLVVACSRAHAHARARAAPRAHTRTRTRARARAAPDGRAASCACVGGEPGVVYFE